MQYLPENAVTERWSAPKVSTVRVPSAFVPFMMQSTRRMLTLMSDASRKSVSTEVSGPSYQRSLPPAGTELQQVHQRSQKGWNHAEPQSPRRPRGQRRCGIYCSGRKSQSSLLTKSSDTLDTLARALSRRVPRFFVFPLLSKAPGHEPF